MYKNLKINSKVNPLVIVLNIRPKIITFLKGSKGENLCNLDYKNYLEKS
jgi:hypothetical protein